MISACFKPYLIFICLGLTAYLGIETGVEFIARLVAKSVAGLQDLRDSLGAALGLWMFAGVYYVLLGIICGSLVRKTGYKQARRLFIIGALALAYLGYTSAHASQEALLQHAWTASALVYLGLVLYGAIVILACLVIRLLAGRRMTKTQSENLN